MKLFKLLIILIASQDVLGVMSGVFSYSESTGTATCGSATSQLTVQAFSGTVTWFPSAIAGTTESTVGAALVSKSQFTLTYNISGQATTISSSAKSASVYHFVFSGDTAQTGNFVVTPIIYAPTIPITPAGTFSTTDGLATIKYLADGNYEMTFDYTVPDPACVGSAVTVSYSSVMTVKSSQST